MSAARPSSGWTASAPVFAALGDKTRLRLVARLGAGQPRSITQLSAGSAITRQAITKHLHVLAGAGLVRSRPRGREQLWELRPRRLEEPRRILDLISRQWDDALQRLKSSLENET